MPKSDMSIPDRKGLHFIKSVATDSGFGCQINVVVQLSQRDQIGNLGVRVARADRVYILLRELSKISPLNLKSIIRPPGKRIT